VKLAGIDGKQPPHDPEAEAFVLGALMFSPEYADALPASLTPRSFYSGSNARIFEAAQDLIRDRVELGVHAVAARLRETGRLEVAGGSPRLMELVNNVGVPVRSVFDRMVSTVVNKGTLRATAAALHEALAKAYAGEDVQANDLLAETERKLQGLAIAATTGGLRHVKEALREEIRAWQDRADGAGVVGIPSGFAALDRNTGGFQRGDLIVLAARPGMGKTSLITACAVNVARRGDATAVFSLEMPAQQLAARMMCTEAALSVLQTRTGKLPQSDLTRAIEACNTLAKLDIFVDDASKGRPTVADICARSRRLAANLARKGRRIGLIVVDYIQIVKLRDDLVKQRHELAVGEVSTELKSLAKELDTTVIGVAQLNRGVESRQDKRPGMADLRDSGQIEQDADIIAMLYRDEYYNPKTPDAGIAEVIIEKQRNGPTGTVKLWFDGPTTRFADLADERDQAAE
jgi:replicative DNA helicase